MAPALDLRLKQHLALTPQLQQALRLLQLSALEFAQEMGEALVTNPFLEEGNQDNKTPHTTTASTLSEPAPAFEHRASRPVSARVARACLAGAAGLCPRPFGVPLAPFGHSLYILAPKPWRERKISLPAPLNAWAAAEGFAR